MFFNNKNPKIKDVPLPEGRTVYAVEHMLRKLKAEWVANTGGQIMADKNGESVSVAGRKRQRTTQQKDTPKDKYGTETDSRATASDDEAEPLAKKKKNTNGINDEVTLCEHTVI
jgi:hypothetical protein